MQINVKQLDYTYSAKTAFSSHALKNVNLTIEEGEFFGIIGHTGSGKSTFIQHLNGLIKLGKNNGQITIGNFNLNDKKCDFKALRSKVGMVFQYPEYQLFAETIFDDIAFGLKNFFPLMTKEGIEDAVKNAMEVVGLDYSLKDKSPFELSGGQKRRVAIAGVIVTKPEILILDEPASGLDPKGKTELFSLLHTLHNSFVKTIIIVSHDMDAVMQNCTKGAIFHQGEIYKTGDMSHIFSDESELISIGLETPLTVHLTNALKKKKININSSFKVNDFIDKFIACYKEKNL